MNLLEQIRQKLADQRAARDTVVADIASIIDTVESDEARSDLTPDETTRMQELRSKLPDLDTDITALEARETELVDVEKRRAEAATRSQDIVPTRVVKEELTYRKGGEHNFFQDAWRSAQMGDREASDRIHRNHAEVMAEHRNTSGSYGVLVAPQYLLDEFAPVLKAGRVFLNAIGSRDLPDEGQTLTIPRGATGTSVAAQQTENTAVNNQTLTTTDLVVNVRTFAGQQVTSRQAMERGRGIGDILMADLMADYATKVNVSALAGSGAAGQHLGVLTSTAVQTAAWTGTTGASFVASIHKGIGLVNEKRFLPVDAIFMSPRRWAWVCAQSDASQRPLVQIDGPGANAVGNGQAAGYGGPVGSIAGVAVYTDAGIPTTLGASTDEDRVIVTRRADNHFWEDGAAPIGFKFEEVKGETLSVQLVAYGYSAFTTERYPVATCVLQGTGFKQVLA